MYTLVTYKLWWFYNTFKFTSKRMKKKVTAKVPMYAKINNIPYKKPIKKTKQTNAESILEKKREGL